VAGFGSPDSGKFAWTILPPYTKIETEQAVSERKIRLGR
jgi:hypothetical protein